MSNCEVIAITNQKGGIGKTTTAINLGVGLAEKGKKVLLIDADPQSNLTKGLGFRNTSEVPFTLCNAIQNIMDKRAVNVTGNVLHSSEGVDLIPASINLAGYEIRMVNAKGRERFLRTCIDAVKENYDYALIDCKPSLELLTINALAAADKALIPMQPHYYATQGLQDLLRSVQKTKRNINPKLQIEGIVFTMVMGRPVISREIVDTVKKVYGQKIKVFDAEIPHSISFVESSAEGKSMMAYAGRHKGAEAYRQLAGEVIELGSKEIKRDRNNAVR